MASTLQQPCAPVAVGRGRPSKYDSNVGAEAEKYVSLCKDVFNMQRRRFDVHLPTIDGFADHMGVNRSTLYRLARKHFEYELALERIKQAQKIRLINGGLAGHYNHVLVKLMLIANHGCRVPKQTSEAILPFGLGRVSYRTDL